MNAAAPGPAPSVRAANLGLGLLGLLSLALAVAQNWCSATGRLAPTWWCLGAQVPLYFAAAWLAGRARAARSTLGLILVVAVLLRIVAGWAEPYLSNDVYRYIWDGRVQAAGINPYRHVPHDPELVGLRDEAIYGKMNRKDYAPTIYPPGAEMVFFLVTRVSERVGWMRFCLVLFEGVAVWALLRILARRGEAPPRILLYAWHPLVIWEFAGNGHVDAVMIACLSLALLAVVAGRRGWVGAALAGAVLVKLYPVVLFPAFYRRWEWRLPAAFFATIAGAYAVYASVGARVLGFLPDYAREEGIEDGRRFFLAGLWHEATGLGVNPAGFKLAAAAALAALGVAAAWRRDRGLDGTLSFAAILGLAFMILLSPNYPWYYSWLIIFLVFLRWSVLSWITAASFLLYLSWSRWYDLNEYEMNRLFLSPALLLAGLALGRLAWRRFRTPHSVGRLAP